MAMESLYVQGGVKLGARKEKSLGKHVNGVGLGERTQTIREAAQR